MPSKIWGQGSTPDDGVLKKYYEELRNSSAGKQITVGAISGWVAGFVFTKFGKTAATAIGGSLLLLHFAHHHGYIKVDWKRLSTEVEKAKKELEKRKEKEIPQLMDKVQACVKENVILVGGFAGGFLLGMASA